MRRWPAGLVPGATARRLQVAAYAAEWEQANAEARAADGPLWVALGDSTAQAVGTSARAHGYVLVVLALLRAQRDPAWRVVNLSRSGARIADVLSDQLPALERLAGSSGPPELVTCAVGVNDLLRTPAAKAAADLRELTRRLPPGALVANLPRGIRGARAEALNAQLRADAARRGLRVVDLWSHTGPPWDHKFSADHFHPNDLGYADWAAAFAEALGLRMPAGGSGAPP